MEFIPIFGSLRLAVDFNTAPALAFLKVKETPYQNLKPVLKSAAQVVRRSFSAQFAQAGDPAWAPLSAFTIARKRRLGLPKRTPKGNIPRRLVQNGNFGPENILIMTGALRDSYVRVGMKGHVENYTEDSVFVGSNLKTPNGKWSLAAIHQFGATINRQSLSRAVRKSSFRKKSKPKVTVSKRGGIVIPARPLRIREVDRSDIKTLFRRHLGGSSVPE